MAITVKLYLQSSPACVQLGSRRWLIWLQPCRCKRRLQSLRMGCGVYASRRGPCGVLDREVRGRRTQQVQPAASFRGLSGVFGEEQVLRRHRTTEGIRHSIRREWSTAKKTCSISGLPSLITTPISTRRRTEILQAAPRAENLCADVSVLVLKVGTVKWNL
jgi:hypothetical protein